MKKTLLSLVLLIFSITLFAQQRLAPVLSAEERLNKEYCTGLFSTPEGTYFDMLNDVNASSASSYLNVLDWLQGRVAGLQVYTWNGNRIPLIRNNRAAIYVNEMRVSADFLNVLSVNDIAMIKVIKAPFAGFGAPGGGVIAIYTIGTDEEEENEQD